MKNLFITFSVILLSISTLTNCGDADIFSMSEKTVHLKKGGDLSDALLLSDLNAITELTITGVIDSRDFKTIRDRMPKLTELDLTKATISAYKGYEGTGGTSVYEYPQNTIPIYSFYNPTSTTSKTSLIKVTLPTSLKSVGVSAFAGCTGLTSITFPFTLTKIDNRAFARCSGMTGKLSIPASVDTIGYSAFTYCTALSSLQLSDSLISIGESAFNGCTGLKGSLNIPTKVKTINDRAFASCKGFDQVDIPASVETIGYYVFLDCDCPVYISTDNQNFMSSDGVLFDFSQMTLKYFPASKSGKYEIPSTVMIVENSAFSNCNALTSVVIPSSVMLIGDYAFQNCFGLTGTFNIPATLFSFGIFVFEGCSGISAYNVEAGNPSYSSTDGVLFDNSQTILYQFPPARTGTYTIPSTVTNLSQGAFLGCANLTSVSIPATVNAIADRVFMNCSGLKSIYEYATTPIPFSNDKKITSWSVFDNVNKTNCTLYVPAGTKPFYKIANQWKDFINILEM